MAQSLNQKIDILMEQMIIHDRKYNSKRTQEQMIIYRQGVRNNIKSLIRLQGQDGYIYSINSIGQIQMKDEMEL